MKSKNHMSLSLSDHQEKKQGHRIAAAWSAFQKHKGKLCSKHYKLRDRIRLFEAVVTPVSLSGCSAWAMIERKRDRLKTTRRKVLRYVF